MSFAGAISLLTAVLFSITPTLHLSLSAMRDGLAEGSRGSAGNTWRRLGSKLVVGELAIAMALLVSAGLLGKSLYRLLRVEIGFQSDHLVTLKVAAPDSGYAKDQQAIALARHIMSRIESLPGVTSVGVSHMGLPLDGNGNTIWFRVLGRPWGWLCNHKRSKLPLTTCRKAGACSQSERRKFSRYCFCRSESRSNFLITVLASDALRPFPPRCS